MRFLAPRLGLFALLPVLAGCAPKAGHVTGKVTYKGNPVPAGWVQFRPADPARNPVTVELKEDGSFEADLPAGEVAVTIDTRDWEPRAAGGVPAVPASIPLSPEARAKLGGGSAPPKAREGEPRAGGRPGKYVPIPAKYSDLTTSRIKFTVKGGPQTETIELTD